MKKEEARRIARAALDPQAAEELAQWQREHPKATLREIEQAVERSTAQLRARLVEEIVGSMAASEQEDPRCPRCGGATQPKGRESRRLKAQAEAEVVLERERRWCATCQAGFFPPR